MESPEPSRDDRTPVSTDSTLLLRKAKAGDVTARNLLVKKHLPALRRWAHGRLPAHARDMVDTDDLVQVTMVRALGHLEGFEPRHAGAFFAYLRQILLNQIRDEIRKASRRPERQELGDDLSNDGPSPLDLAIGRDARERYERALLKLSPDQQEAVVLRLELGFTYAEMAEALERSTANAARLLVTRALVRLAREMHEGARGRVPR